MLYNLQWPSLKGFPNYFDEPHSLAFIPGDKLLAVGGQATLSLWEMPSGKFRNIDGIHGPVDRLHFSDDGKKLYLRTDCVQVAEIAEQGLQQYRGVIAENFQPAEYGRGNGSGDTAFSMPNRWIASCPLVWQTNGGEISLWDIERKQLHKVICHDGVQSLDFTPAGQLVTASIRPESTITTVLDLKTGRELVRLGHFGQAVFSPTGEVFATLKTVPRSVNVIRNPHGYVEVEKTPPAAGLYGGMELWETHTGRKLAELPHDALKYLQFSPNGKIISSVGSESTKLWQISHLIRDAAK